jgi:hypothetical protein
LYDELGWESLSDRRSKNFFRRLWRTRFIHGRPDLSMTDPNYPWRTRIIHGGPELSMKDPNYP